MSDTNCQKCGKPKANGLSMSAFGSTQEYRKRCHGHADEAKPKPSKPPVATCPDCSHPAHKRACGWYNMASSVPKERYCSCTARAPKAAKRKPQPTSEAKPVAPDLTALINTLRYEPGYDDETFTFDAVERDEIVKWLRVGRVLEAKGVLSVTKVWPDYQIRVEVAAGEFGSTHETLDDAERIKFGGGER